MKLTTNNMSDKSDISAINAVKRTMGENTQVVIIEGTSRKRPAVSRLPGFKQETPIGKENVPETIPPQKPVSLKETQETENFLRNFLVSWKDYPIHTVVKGKEDEMVLLHLEHYRVNGVIPEEIWESLRYASTCGLGAVQVWLTTGEVGYMDLEYYETARAGNIPAFFLVFIPVSVVSRLEAVKREKESPKKPVFLCTVQEWAKFSA